MRWCVSILWFDCPVIFMIKNKLSNSLGSIYISPFLWCKTICASWLTCWSVLCTCTCTCGAVVGWWPTWLFNTDQIRHRDYRRFVYYTRMMRNASYLSSHRQHVFILFIFLKKKKKEVFFRVNVMTRAMWNWCTTYCREQRDTVEMVLYSLHVSYANAILLPVALVSLYTPWNYEVLLAPCCCPCNLTTCTCIPRSTGANPTRRRPS